MAKSRILFRTILEPMGMATCPNFRNRGRDTNRHELIADNDNADTYFETGTEKVKWENGSTGFAHTVSVYTGTRNPFDDGSFRQTKTTTDPRKEIQAH